MKFIELLLPAQCLVCALPSHHRLICRYCEKKILAERNHCLHCALSLHQPSDFCGDCITKKYLFEHIHALGDYTKPLSTLIKQLKYQQQLIAGELLSSLLLSAVVTRYTEAELAKFDLILAVPLHPNKLRKRGFNQAKILCQQLHKALHIPLIDKQVLRIKETIAQEGLSAAKRQKNLKDAFVINKDPAVSLTGKNIIIVDDVVTTGATLNSLCQVLKNEQVASITVFCISRTALPNTF